MSDWGEGALNNNIGWGKGFNNTISWGSIYSTSYAGETSITGSIPAFAFTVNTANLSTGSSTVNQFKLPLLSTFNGVTANVEWGDGSTDTITAFNQAEVTHTYSSSGSYQIKITNACRGFSFISGGDRLKITNISNYGILNINGQRSFINCSNLLVSATDAPIISTTSLSLTFGSCSALTTIDLSKWVIQSTGDISSLFLQCTALITAAMPSNMSFITNTSRLFEGCPNLNDTRLNSLNTSSITNISRMFFSTSVFNLVFAAWDINQVITFTDFLNSSTLNTANYDATLISWNNQAPLTGKSISFGNSKFTLGGAAASARASLISVYGWTITDGGGI